MEKKEYKQCFSNKRENTYKRIIKDITLIYNELYELAGTDKAKRIVEINFNQAIKDIKKHRRLALIERGKVDKVIDEYVGE